MKIKVKYLVFALALTALSMEPLTATAQKGIIKDFGKSAKNLWAELRRITPIPVVVPTVPQTVVPSPRLQVQTVTPIQQRPKVVRPSLGPLTKPLGMPNIDSLTRRTNLLMRQRPLPAFRLFPQSATPSIDRDMEDAAMQLIIDETASLNVSRASVVVIETETGNVRTHLALEQKEDEWQNATLDNSYYPDCNLRASCYLALLESGMQPDEVFYTPGIYQDTTGQGIDGRNALTLRDWQVPEPCYLPLSTAMDRSNIVMAQALSERFGQSPEEFHYYLSRAGVWLGYSDTEMGDDGSMMEPQNLSFNPTEVFSHENQLLTIHMAMWMQGIANDGMMLTPRLFQVDGDSINNMCKLRVSQENLELLKDAMRRSVVYGMAQGVNINGVTVYGTTYISNKDLATRQQCSSFSGFMPKYTIVVNLMMEGEGLEYASSNIARKLIFWIATNRL